MHLREKLVDKNAWLYKKATICCRRWLYIMLYLGKLYLKGKLGKGQGATSD